MRIWFDTEFREDGIRIDLISIGLVRQDGAEYYAETIGADLLCSTDWLKANVLPNLTGRRAEKYRHQIAREIIEFAGDAPEFWAYYADYDWVALCQLYGTMMDLPKGWPMFCLDVKQLAHANGISKITVPQTEEHDAMHDARWTCAAWRDVLGPVPTLNRQ